MYKKLHPRKQRDVITHPCPNFSVEVGAWVCDYILYKTLGVIIYPFSKTNHIKPRTYFMDILYEYPGSLLLIRINLSPAWISNYNYYKMWDEITYPFPNFNGWRLGMDE